MTCCLKVIKKLYSEPRGCVFFKYTLWIINSIASLGYTWQVLETQQKHYLMTICCDRFELDFFYYNVSTVSHTVPLWPAV